MHNIAILGYGTVGSGVHHLIKNNAKSIAANSKVDLNVKYICDIRDFSAHEDAELFVKDIDTILADSSVEAVVETIGGAKIAYTFVKKALEAKKHVATSNKELVAQHGAQLMALAKQNNVCFLFEASVGGGTPLIMPMCTSLAANNISEIKGIVNGTTNFMLGKMQTEGMNFESALKQAQQLGYAETIDPSADVDGHDAARKLAILASMVLKKAVKPQNIKTRGIRHITPADINAAQKLNRALKLVAWFKASDGKPMLGVEPAFVSNESLLAHTNDVFNTIELVGDMLGPTAFFASGAGSLPTASAVVADVINAVMFGTKIHDCLFWQESADFDGVYEDGGEYDFYVRFNKPVPENAGSEKLEENALVFKQKTMKQLEELLAQFEQNGFKEQISIKLI